jgi:hypothetical protein
VAGKPWSAIKDALNDWHNERREKAKEKIKEDTEKLKQDIVRRLESSANNKTPTASKLEEQTTLSAEAKAEMLSPKSKKTQVKADGPESVAFYTESIIIDDESYGTNVIQVVKLDDMRKKDETTGLTLDKLAKAVEFGTSRSAPHPAWRRSLKKVEITGTYKKKN